MNPHAKLLDIQRRNWNCLLLILFLLWGSLGTALAQEGVPGSLSITEFQRQFFSGMQPYKADMQELILDANNRIILMGAIVTPPNSISYNAGYVFVGNNPMPITSLSMGSRIGDQISYAANFQTPGILGNEIKAVQFLFNGTSVSSNNGRGEIKVRALDMCTLADFYYEINPAEGRYGFGGKIQLPLALIGVGLEVDAKVLPNAGPVTAFNPSGYSLDLTRLHVESSKWATGFSIPVGATGLEVSQIGMEIKNDGGLSNPANWANSKLWGALGMDTIAKVAPMVPLFGYTGQGWWDVHAGSFEFEGNGKLLKFIPVMENKLKFVYPYDVDSWGKFEVLFFAKATVTLKINSSSFEGSARGDLKIPDAIPVVGGYSFAGAEARIHNAEFRGSVSIQITPKVPSVCTPRVCTPQVCTTVYYPSWCGWHPCIDSKEVCTPEVCIPEVCTPEIPAVKAGVSFSFDVSSGSFGFSAGKKDSRNNSWETPYNMPLSIDSDTAITFMNDWVQTGAVTTGQRAPGVRAFAADPRGTPLTDFTISSPVPAAIFRLNYANADAAKAVMSLTLPDGTVLNLADGALPYGFPNVYGFSHFTPERREAFFCLIAPPVGACRVTVGNPAELGDFTVDLLQQTYPPQVNLTSINPTATPGVYTIAWESQDIDSKLQVRVYLDPDRKDRNGTLAASFEENKESKTCTLDTRTLNLNPGYYYIMLEVADENHEPAYVYSQTPIHVLNERHPQPASKVAAVPGNGEFDIKWEASPSPDVVGYLIFYSEDDGRHNYADVKWVWTDKLFAKVEGVKNGVPLLVTVVAVNSQGLGAEFADILRVIPQVEGEIYPPIIYSTPDPDTTAGYQYMYIPNYIDVSFGALKWDLLEAPKGMNLDPSGLITWTPQANQVGTHSVILLLTEMMAANQIVYATQEFSMTVYPPDQIHGVDEYNCCLMNPIALTAAEGTLYQSPVILIGPKTASAEYILAEGPDGMKVDQTGLIQWNVPIGGHGGRVRVLVIVDGADVLEQSFFLHVYTKDNSNVFPLPSNVPGWELAE